MMTSSLRENLLIYDLPFQTIKLELIFVHTRSAISNDKILTINLVLNHHTLTIPSTDAEWREFENKLIIIIGNLVTSNEIFLPQFGCSILFAISEQLSSGLVVSVAVMVGLDTYVYAVVIEAMKLRDAKHILREIINDVPALMETCILTLNQTLENRHHSFFIYQILGGLVNGKNKGSNLTEYVMLCEKLYEQVDVCLWTVACVF
eukprot:371264_1